jgi:carboxyl-terminal processing protease
MLLKLHNNTLLGILLLLAVGFALGAAVFRFADPPRTVINGITIIGPGNVEATQPEGVDFAPFWKTWQLIEEHYVNRDELDRQKLLEGAIRGLVESLGDPYSVFLTPQEEKEFIESVEGNFEGVGIEIGIRNNILTVIAPISGAPADRAGIRAGDLILEIDGTATKNMALAEAVSLIRGPRGTVVTLTISREGWQEAREFTIERAMIRIPSVTLERPERDVAVLKIHNFHSRVMPEFRNAVRQVTRHNIQNIIVDLRNNPGGFLNYAIEVGGWFFHRDEIVAKTDEGDGPVVCERCRASGNALFTDPRYKIVVLVNEGSASAAEILAGALRANRGITIVGTQTFGKGSVQEIISVDGAGALKITTAKWLTPDGVDISENGITPDVIVKNPEPEGAREPEDLQLKRAIEIIKSL